MWKYLFSSLQNESDFVIYEECTKIPQMIR